ncbi:hypothetical protein ACS0TY_032967 [Phlomoides rotata]
MVFTRCKGLMEAQAPEYDAKSKYATVNFYYHGNFTNTRKPEYIGGERIVFDFVKTDILSISELDKYCRLAVVKEKGKGMKRYYLRLNDMSFKFLVDDDDVRKWAAKYLAFRELHIYVDSGQVESDGGKNVQNELEIESDGESYEDPDFVIGNEMSDDERDDEIYKQNVVVLDDEGF